MANLNNFNADENPSQNFETLPVGWYKAVITKSDYVPNKKGTGKVLKFMLSIVDGKYKGRTIPDNLNIEHIEETAQRIGKARLGDICRSVNVLHPKDSSELHNKPLEVYIAIEPAQNGYPEKNVIKQYRKIEQAQQPAAPTGQSAATAQEKKPWEA